MKILAAFLITAFIFLFSMFSFSQEIRWQNALGGNSSDILYSINPTPDGGYICGGRSDSPISGDKSKPKQGKTDYWVIKIDSIGNKEWDKVQGGSYYDYLSTVIPTTDGGFMCGGTSLSGISGHKTDSSRGAYDFWIVKLNSGGNIHWQKTIGGSGSDWLTTIIESSDGGYFVAGYSGSPVSGEKTEDVVGGMDYWVLKLDVTGAIEWQNSIGGASIDELSFASPTADNGIICGGSSSSGISGDKSEASRGGKDYWIVKIDSTGSLEWDKTFGGSADDFLASIVQTPDGGFICGGSSKSGISGDKTETGRGFDDYWILKLDTVGNLEWQKTLGGAYYDNLYSINITADGGYICAGRSESDITFDKTEPSLFYDCWVIKLNATGNIEWQNSIGGIEIDNPAVIHEIDTNEFIVGAYSISGISGDKTEASQGDWDFWILKLTDQFNSITGKAFVDSNSDGVMNVGEVPINHILITESTTGRIAYTNSNGEFMLSVVDTGNFTISPPALNHHSLVPTSHSGNFQGFIEIDSLNDFAYQPIGTINDLQVTLTPTTAFRPGFNASYYINYQNIGNTTLNTIIVLYPDPNLTFSSSNPVATSVTTDSIYWNIGNLGPFQSGNIQVSFILSNGVAIGTAINSGVTIEPVIGDAQPINNSNYWEVITTGSYDPNDILVDRDTLYSIEIPNPPYLDYIIRFQNTGNDTAFNVKILNNIDTTKLQFNTLQFVSSSHPVTMRYIHWERNMEFKFDNILLPDSNINEPESHGFIRYRIKPKSNLLISSQIKNAAGIYFDFNAVVQTNIALTIFVLPTGIETVDEESLSNFVFPNPAKDHINIDISEWEGSEVSIEIYNVYGQVLHTVYSDKVPGDNFKIDYNLKDLPAGIFFVKIQSGKGINISRVLKM